MPLAEGQNMIQALAPKRFDQAFSVWARFASDCVVVDAARIEPVSTLQFPANREINSVFCRLELFAALFVSK
jgi:hypothetical protein